MKCKECNADLTTGTLFCNHCGAEVANSETQVGGSVSQNQDGLKNERPLARVMPLLVVILVFCLSWYLMQGNGMVVAELVDRWHAFLRPFLRE